MERARRLAARHGAAEVRHKEIVYSSRTRAATDQYKKMQKLRIALANVIKRLPEELKNDPDVQMLEQETDEKVCNIVHLIYRAQSYEGVSKDFEFSRRTMEEHWQAATTTPSAASTIPRSCSCPTGSKAFAPSMSAGMNADRD